MRHTLVPSIAIAFLTLAGCSGGQVDVAKALQVTDVTTGWFDAGIVEGHKNKLVPTISLRLKNNHTGGINSVQLFARFNQMGDRDQEWGTPPYVRAIGPEGLEPGKSTPLLVLTSNLGYTGEEPRLDMLQNRHFKDAQVQVFVKYRANNWVKICDRQIARQLITR